MIKMYMLPSIIIHTLCVLYSQGTLQEKTLQKDAVMVNLLCPAATITFGTAKSAMNCAQLCKTDAACESLFYHKTTKECYGSDTTIVSTNGCEVRPGMVYYKQEVVEYGKSCTSDADCPSMYTECSAGVCNCVAGAPYDHSSGQCVDSCVEYGHSYTGHYGLYLWASTIMDYTSVTQEQCEINCSALPDCNGYTYSPTRTKCRLHASTPLSNTSSYVENQIANYYTRNCL